MGASESRRSATQRAPVARLTAAPTSWTEVGGDVVSTTSIPSRRAMRIAAGIAVTFHVDVLVRNEHAAGSELACARARSRPCRAVQLLGGLPRRAARGSARGGPTPASAAAVRVRVHPLWVVGREHVRLDPERGEVRCELQRALDAHAPGRREVQRDEQDAH